MFYTCSAVSAASTSTAALPPTHCRRRSATFPVQPDQLPRPSLPTRLPRPPHVPDTDPPASTSAALSIVLSLPRASQRRTVNTSLHLARLETSLSRFRLLANSTHRSRKHGRSGRKPHYVEVHTVCCANALSLCTHQDTLRCCTYHLLLWLPAVGIADHVCTDHADIDRCFGDKGDVEDITEGKRAYTFLFLFPGIMLWPQPFRRHRC